MFSTFGWLGGCWAKSCIWAWWWLRARKIFVYEAIEITRQDDIPIRLHQKVMRKSRWENKPEIKHATQTIAKIIYVRLKVTVSLYLSPNNMARSRSTLMAVIEQRNSTQCIACYFLCVPCVPTKTPVFVNHRHPVNSTVRLGNKTNQQISCCQTTIQELGWRMKARFLVKGNEDKRISKNCCDGEENIDCWEWNGLLFKLTYPNRGT